MTVAAGIKPLDHITVEYDIPEGSTPPPKAGFPPPPYLA